MNKEKARRHLKSAYESLKDIVSNINECKERISRLQRYAY